MSTLTSADFGELKRPTTRVHAPPGGGSSWSFGGDDAPAQASRGAGGKKRFDESAAPQQQQQQATPPPAPVAAAPVAAASAVATAPGTLRIALVKTKSDAEVVDLMVQNCWAKLQAAGSQVAAETFTVSTLDELPYAANKLTQYGGFDGVICFGFLNALDPLFQVLATAVTQAFIDISVKNVKPVVRAIFIGEPRVASVKAKGGWGADFADAVAPLAALGGFVGPIPHVAEGHGVTKHVDISRGNVLPARLLGASQGVLHSVDQLRDSLYQHGAR